MKYLITGGAGFIGSNIAEELVKRRQTVRILDNFTTGKMQHLEKIKDKVEIIKGDIQNEKDLEKALKDIDIVFHEAALRSVPRSVDDPLSTNDVNITGTLKLLIAARNAKVKRVVYASSSSAYGDSMKIPQKEVHATSPISPYATSKLAAEHYCRVFAKTFGLETVSLRYFNVFGPKQDPDSKYSAVIPKFIESALKNEPLEIHGDGKQSRDFTFIDNVVQANLLAATVKGISGEVFNIACNESNTVMDIGKNIEKILGKKLTYNHTPSRAGDIRKTCADISKAIKMMNYNPKVKFDEGIKKTFIWFKKEFGF